MGAGLFVIALLLLYFALLLLYFLPAIIGRKKRNANAITALNLLLGWTLIGWVVALVWALTVEQQPRPLPPAPAACPYCNALIASGTPRCPGCGRSLLPVAPNPSAD